MQAQQTFLRAVRPSIQTVLWTCFFGVGWGHYAHAAIEKITAKVEFVAPIEITKV